MGTVGTDSDPTELAEVQPRKLSGLENPAGSLYDIEIGSTDPEMNQPVTTDSTVQSAGKRRWKRIACYLPLAAVALELVWIVLLFMALIFAVGDTPYVNTPDKTRFFSLLSAGPAAGGVLFGVIAILLRLPVKIVDWVFLIAGGAGCACLLILCTNGIW